MITLRVVPSALQRKKCNNYYPSLLMIGQTHTQLKRCVETLDKILDLCVVVKRTYQNERLGKTILAERPNGLQAFTVLPFICTGELFQCTLLVAFSVARQAMDGLQYHHANRYSS